MQGWVVRVVIGFVMIAVGVVTGVSGSGAGSWWLAAAWMALGVAFLVQARWVAVSARRRNAASARNDAEQRNAAEQHDATEQ
jgi:hypothetical protein